MRREGALKIVLVVGLLESLWRKPGLDYTQFKWFLIWALRKAEPDGTN